jgi:hypothetical protein
MCENAFEALNRMPQTGSVTIGNKELLSKAAVREEV